ncbi:MAG: hypothetical protein IJ420_04590 [Lachnospiraceae bacterium]|nr:hypothetical protein [Lachnospiraceae bacterium]
MLGVLYILLCVLCGSAICGLLFRNLGKPAEEAGLPAFMVKIPAWYLIGTLAVTWPVYLFSYLFQNTEKPLLWGNLVTWLLAIGFVTVVFLVNKGKKNVKEMISGTGSRTKEFFFMEKESQAYGPILFTFAAVAFTGFLMFLTFKVLDNSIYVGYSVFSDFAPHLGMIRSFSVSNNFPTQYAHFAGEDIRYHFMFQFMVGNLEFLGMRLDFAFNLPSMFGMIGTYMLLFVLVVRLTKSRLCGYLTALLFTFRSSFTVFRYMAEQPKDNVWNALKSNTEFLGYTQNENWGLWNLNVYCNQRHLAFALAMLVLAILLFFPYVEAMGKKLLAVQKGEKLTLADRVEQVKTLFFTKTAFGIKDIHFAVGMGVFLGALAFWNGSALVATLAMLFFMAAVSDYRLDYLITAVLVLVFYFLQSSLFVEGSVVSPAYFFGFLAENKTAWGVVLFIVELTGIVLFVAIAGATMVKGTVRYMLLVFLVPFVLAFTLALTGDITVNHKWIMMSLMLVSMFAAIVLTNLLKSGDWLKRIVAIVLLVVLTATGVYDLTTVVKRNENHLIFSYDDPVTNWIAENATCDDVFLTPYYSLNNVVMGGAMLYYGWPYYAWSAGYDTYSRDREVKKMYEASSVEQLDAWIEEHNIRYIIVDHDCRTSSEYDVREDVIEAAYEAVFEHDTNDWMVRIFDTTKEK